MADAAAVYMDDNNNVYRAVASDDKRSGGRKRTPDKGQHGEDKPENQKSGSVITIIMISVVAALLLGAVVFSLDKRNTMYNKVAALNTELGIVQDENVRLQSELESRISAQKVEDYAINELGMRKIDSSQITYIKIQTDDVVNIPEQEEGIIARITGFLEECVEYFRG